MTDLLRDLVNDDARTERAQRLVTTFTWCAMGLLGVLLVTALTVAVVVHGTAGWVPVAGGGGLLGLLGIARWMAARRRPPPAAAGLLPPPRELGDDRRRVCVASSVPCRRCGAR